MPSLTVTAKIHQESLKARASDSNPLRSRFGPVRWRFIFSVAFVVLVFLSTHFTMKSSFRINSSDSDDISRVVDIPVNGYNKRDNNNNNNYISNHKEKKKNEKKNDNNNNNNHNNNNNKPRNIAFLSWDDLGKKQPGAHKQDNFHPVTPAPRPPVAVAPEAPPPCENWESHSGSSYTCQNLTALSPLFPAVVAQPVFVNQYMVSNDNDEYIGYEQEHISDRDTVNRRLARGEEREEEEEEKDSEREVEGERSGLRMQTNASDSIITSKDHVSYLQSKQQQQQQQRQLQQQTKGASNSDDGTYEQYSLPWTQHTLGDFAESRSLDFGMDGSQQPFCASHTMRNESRYNDSKCDISNSSFDFAKNQCESIGARLCTLDEVKYASLTQSETSQTCAAKVKSRTGKWPRVWTSTRCGEGMAYARSAVRTGGLRCYRRSYRTPTMRMCCADKFAKQTCVAKAAIERQKVEAEPTCPVGQVRQRSVRPCLDLADVDAPWDLIRTPGAEVCHTQRLYGVCAGSVTFQRAKNLCMNAGARLCTLKEARKIFSISNGFVPAQQCDEWKAIWTSTQCAIDGTSNRVGQMTASTRYNTTDTLDTWPLEQCVNTKNSMSTTSSKSKVEPKLPLPLAYVSCCADTESSHTPTCAPANDESQRSIRPDQLSIWKHKRSEVANEWKEACGIGEGVKNETPQGPHPQSDPIQANKSKFEIKQHNSALRCATTLSTPLIYPAFPASAVTSIDAFAKLVGNLCEVRNQCKMTENTGGGRWVKVVEQSEYFDAGENDYLRKAVDKLGKNSKPRKVRPQRQLKASKPKSLIDDINKGTRRLEFHPHNCWVYNFKGAADSQECLGAQDVAVVGDVEMLRIYSCLEERLTGKFQAECDSPRAAKSKFEMVVKAFQNNKSKFMNFEVEVSEEYQDSSNGSDSKASSLRMRFYPTPVSIEHESSVLADFSTSASGSNESWKPHMIFVNEWREFGFTAFQADVDAYKHQHAMTKLKSNDFRFLLDSQKTDFQAMARSLKQATNARVIALNAPWTGTRHKTLSTKELAAVNLGSQVSVSVNHIPLSPNDSDHHDIPNPAGSLGSNDEEKEQKQQEQDDEYSSDERDRTHEETRLRIMYNTNLHRFVKLRTRGVDMSQLSVLDWFDITLSYPSKRPMLSRDVYEAAGIFFLNFQCPKTVREAAAKSAGHICEKGECTTCTSHVARIPWQRASKSVIKYLKKNMVPTLFPGYTKNSWTGGNWADVIAKSGDMPLRVRSNYGSLGTRTSKTLQLRQVVKSFLSHDPTYEQVSTSPTRTASVSPSSQLGRGAKVKTVAGSMSSSNDHATGFGGGDTGSIGAGVALEALPKYAGNNKLPPAKAVQLGVVLPIDLSNKRLEKPSLWLGGQGSFSVLHADHRNGGNIIQQCLGQKRFYIFPPNAMKYLNVQTRNSVRWGIPADPRYVEVNAAQERQFPAAAAIGMTVLLKPGDMFMNQDSFYHAAENETPSLMVNTWIKP